jgi:hypothetical protein
MRKLSIVVSDLKAVRNIIDEYLKNKPPATTTSTEEEEADYRCLQETLVKIDDCITLLQNENVFLVNDIFKEIIYSFLRLSGNELAKELVERILGSVLN